MEEQRSSTASEGECLWGQSLQRRHGGGRTEPTALLLHPQVLSQGGRVRSCSLSCAGSSETNPREVSQSADGKMKPPGWFGLVLAWPGTKARDHVPARELQSTAWT